MNEPRVEHMDKLKFYIEKLRFKKYPFTVNINFIFYFSQFLSFAHRPTPPFIKNIFKRKPKQKKRKFQRLIAFRTIKILNVDLLLRS